MNPVFLATETAPALDKIISDLTTATSGILDNASNVFGFLTSSTVLPWILIGTAVSLVSVGIWWVKWITWGK